MFKSFIGSLIWKYRHILHNTFTSEYARLLCLVHVCVDWMCMCDFMWDIISQHIIYMLCFAYWLFYIRQHVFFLLGVAYFTKHNGIQLRPFCCRWQDFIVLCVWVVFHLKGIVQALYLYFCWLAFGVDSISLLLCLHKFSIIDYPL